MFPFKTIPVDAVNVSCLLDRSHVKRELLSIKNGVPIYYDIPSVPLVSEAIPEKNTT